MKYLIYLVSLLPLFTRAQNVEGIQFEQAKSWEEILEKAKLENKYIFMDCYATWCVPCKKMDKEVYPNDTVGMFMNDKFISVKLQIDTSINDDEHVKKWYAVAQDFNVKYKLTSLPSYLFFSPEGEIVHRDGNYVSSEDFIKIAGKALDPSTQFYTLLRQYNNGQKDYQVMTYLARTAQSLGESTLANTIALDYKMNYLDKVDESFLFNKDILDFITRDFFSIFYDEGSKGRYLDFFIRQGDSLGKIQYPDFASYLIKAIIKKEELLDKLYKGDNVINKNPNWHVLENNIIRKYGDLYSSELLLWAQCGFYKKLKNWGRYTELVDKQVMQHYNRMGSTTKFLYTDEQFPISDTWILNGAAWSLFLQCSSRKELLTALKWSELSIQLESVPDMAVQYYDTKANLLYKVGRVKEAIETEYAAIEMDDRNAKNNGMERGGFHEDFSDTIDKMKNGHPTWPVDKK